MADISNSLGQLSGGSFNQNNIDIIKFTKVGPLNLLQKTEILDATNNLGTYTINEFQSLWIKVISIGKDGFPTYTLTYKILNKGKGTYGIGETQFVLEDMLLVEIDKTTIEDIDTLPETDIIDFGNIGSSTIFDYLNIQDPSIIIQSQDEGYTLFYATIDGEEVAYLFVGDAGTYGLSDLQSVEQDFQLLSNFNNGLQDLQSVIEQGGIYSGIETYIELSDNSVYLTKGIENQYSEFQLQNEQAIIGSFFNDGLISRNSYLDLYSKIENTNNYFNSLRFDKEDLTTNINSYVKLIFQEPTVSSQISLSYVVPFLEINDNITLPITVNGEFADASGNITISGGGDSILERVNQGNGDGIIIKGRDEVYYGNVGESSLDLSLNYSDYGIFDTGATGPLSVALGISTTASGSYSTAFGVSTIASGENSTAFGTANVAEGILSTSFGYSNYSIGKYEITLGSLGTIFLPTDLEVPERIFNIGNGNDRFSRSDAFQVWHNGLAYLPTAINSEITAATDDVIPTKGWVIANSGGGAVDSVNGQTGVVVLDADDISDTSTTNKWTNASEKATWNGKENATNKQNSLTTDGTGVKFPTVDAVNTALTLKQDNPNVILDLTDRSTTATLTTLHVVSSYAIPANTLSNNSILKYMTSFDRTGTAGNSSMGIYLDTSPGTIGSAVSGTAQLIAAATMGTTGRIPNFERTFKLASNLLTGFPAGVNSPTDAVVATSALTSTPLTPSTTYYLITGVINNSAADIITQRFTSLTQRK